MYSLEERIGIKGQPVKMYDNNEVSDKGFEITKVDEGHYAVADYGCGNVGFVVTKEGIVVIDANTKKEAAANILKEIRTITNLPVKYLIYTHGHADHVGGAQVFKDEGAKVIAHENVSKRFRRYTKFSDYHTRINGIQSGNGGFGDKENWSNFVYPDIEYSNNEYTFELGGKTFRLIHGKGETDDATVVYVPEDRIIYSGDFILNGFPNIGNPNKVIRYEQEWYEMLDWISDIQPKAVIPGHGKVLTGEDLQNSLKHASEALKFLYEKSVEFINKGYDLDYIIENVKLPEHLEKSPYIKQLYGNREFTLRGIHRRYTGWYNGNPTNLNPSPKKEVVKAIYELIGDKNKIYDEIFRYKDHNPQLALHLLDIILGADTEDKQAHRLKGELLKRLAETSNNLFYINFYLHESQKEFELADSVSK